jgi:hypothetical protein
MLFKCDHCSYATKRRGDLIRHENRKISCIKKIEEVSCNLEERDNHNIIQPNDNVIQPIVNVEQPIDTDIQPNDNVIHPNDNVIHPNDNVIQTIDTDIQPIVNVIQPNDTDIQQNYNVPKIMNSCVKQNARIFQCCKCDKILSSKQKLKSHEEKCDGYDKKQCKICLRMFATRQGKSQHTRYVKCTPPAAPAGPSTINNIDNSINNTYNINNTINFNIRGNFDTIGKKDIENIVKQLEKSDYIKMVQNNMTKGKYVVPRTIEHLYFNDDFPEMQTLKKERRNDKMVEVHVDGKWEKRLVDDIMKKLISKVEDYHTDYFKYLEEKFKDIPIGSKEWNIAVRPIKNFGHMMLWYNGFSGRDIENIGIELNYPDDEKEKKAKNKDMAKLVKEKIYEFTPKSLVA